MRPDSYTEVHRYDGAVLERGKRDQLVPCAVRARDVAIVRDVWRYKFLTSSQLLELWWPGRPPQAGSRRLLKLHRAGYLDRFRPVARNGSYAWTHHLGLEGHRLLQRTGAIAPGARFACREIYDYTHVLHDLQLNAWVIAYRRALGSTLVAWDGETDIHPPAHARRQQLRLDDNWSAEGLAHREPRALRPDAILEIARGDAEGTSRLFLVEHDRTRRIDKNYDKLRRYDAFLCWWWRHSQLERAQDEPWVLFVCQDEQQRQVFLDAADHELTGHRWHPNATPADYLYTGRRRMLFATEHDAHAGHLEARRVPAFPPGHPARGEHAQVGRVRLPGSPPAVADAA